MRTIQMEQNWLGKILSRYIIQKNKTIKNYFDRFAIWYT